MKTEEGRILNRSDLFNLFLNLIVSVLIVTFSLLIPDRAQTENDLKNMRYGIPFAFLIQDLTYKASSSSYPIWLTPGAPMEHFTKGRPLVYVLDIVVIWFLLLVCYKKLTS